MAEVRHYINGKDFGEPRNWQDLEITIDWLNNNDSGSVNVTDLEFVLEANEYLQKRILDGLSGGRGIFEGEPYKIAVGNQESPEYVFDGYLDFTEEMTVFGKEEIVCSLKKRKGEDWLNDIANGFSFASLYDEGIVLKSDFVSVPYVINYVPDGTQLVILSMSIYMMTKELIENVEKLAETISDVINASTPVVGVGVGFGAVVVTAWDLGDFIMVILKAIARLAYIIAMTIAIINLIDEVLKQLLPKKRSHLGMTYRRMMERSCQKLGMTFQSSIKELNWVYIPTKDKKGGTAGETGYPTNTDPHYTFGGLITELKKMFNADYRMSGNVFSFERKDKFIFPSSYQIPNSFNNQDRLLDQFSLNADEMVSNYNVYYSLDIQDQNTLDNSDGRVFQAITSPTSISDKDLVLTKNIAEISIPASLGVYKTDLTSVEKVAKVLGTIVDGLTGIFGSGTNFESQIESRIGSLLLSSDFLTVGKIVKMNGSKLAKDQRGEVGVQLLWDKFHHINSFAEYKGHHNQYFRYKEIPVVMSIEEFAINLESNHATDNEGNEFIIEKIIYNPYKSTALVDYRVKKKYTNNLKITFH